MDIIISIVILSFWINGFVDANFPTCHDSTSWAPNELSRAEYEANRGNKNGFPNADALSTCSRICKSDKKTFYGLKRNGPAGRRSKCYCGDVLPTEVAAASCTYTCGSGRPCGGSGKMSIYPVCDLGMFGTNCESPCHGHCSHDVCNIQDGSCDYGCTDGWYGETYCEQQCGKCEDTACNQRTGSCDSGCTNGWFGSHCKNQCGHCVNGACNGDTGVCDSGCTNGWYGDKCIDSCSLNCYGGCNRQTGGCDRGCINGWYGTNCDNECGQCVNGVCDRDTGVCDSGCVNGWYGDMCNSSCSENCLSRCDQQTGSCASCKTGFYGQMCENACPQNCYSSCHQHNGSCHSCITGWFGDKCESQCPENCLYDKCDQHTGECYYGCDPGWYGPHCDCGNCQSTCDSRTWTCDVCTPGWYSDKCTTRCPENCSSDCEKTTGICQSCKTGLYGDRCTETCPVYCGSSGCEKATGTCESCREGWYGEKCTFNCSDHCVQKVCKQKTGECLRGCVHGYFGHQCENQCTNCLNQSCNTSGYCVNGCNHGYRGDMCADACPENCLDGNCHSQTAFCLQGCKEGWKGDRCIEEVGNNTTIIAVAASVSAVVIVIAVVAIVVMRKRRSQIQNQDSKKSSRRDSWTVNDDRGAPRNDRRGSVMRPPPAADVVNRPQATVVTQPKELDKKPKSHLVNVKDYSRFYRGKLNDASFNDEYQSLPCGLLHPQTAANRPGLPKGKNHFKNIYPYDYNRVVLSQTNGDPLTDYINASKIQGYNQDDQYIASLGPRKATLEDFWRMVLEQRVPVIVMLTNPVENTVTKCEEYWPTSENSSKSFGNLDVTLVKVDEWPNYTIRKLTVRKNNITHAIIQYHFTVWPDHGVPPDATALLNFRRKVLEAPRKSAEYPVIVHCSAGVGRTGTYLALDFLIKQVDNEGGLDVFGCVESLRQQRVHLVQTQEQYVFLHKALEEYILVGSTKKPAASFETYIRNVEPEELSKQFQVLQDLSPVVDSSAQSIALNKDNKPKNRFEHILPNMDKIFYLKKHIKGCNNYINAIIVHGFQKRNAFIVTQIPLENTIEDFWRLMMDSQSKTVIMIVDNANKKDMPHFLPTKSKPMAVLSSQITVSDTAEHKLYSMREMLVQAKSGKVGNSAPDVNSAHEFVNNNDQSSRIDNNQNDDEASVRVYEIQISSSGYLEEGPVTEVFMEVQKWNQSNGNPPTVVCCWDGATYSGQYVTISNLFEMINSEQEVDVFQAVKQVRDSRPQFINTMEQYSNLHNVAKRYIEAFFDYANFK